MVRETTDIPGVVFVDRRAFPTSDFGGLARALVLLADRIHRRLVDPSGGIFPTRE